jgi:hypothetical protein
MRYLFDQSECDAMIARINKLTPDSNAVWGKMTVSQALTHMQKPLQVALGELEIPKSIMGMLFGKMAKKTLVNDKPFSKNLPTAPVFVVKNVPDFEKEKEKLIALIKKFQAAGPGGVTKKPHGFFGPMTEMEYSKSNWKHLDHHLRQFGV